MTFVRDMRMKSSSEQGINIKNAKNQTIKKAKSVDFAFLAVTSAVFAANKLSDIR